MPNTKLPVEKIPQCLRDRPQWVCWSYIERNGKQTKVPINARHGSNASVTDPQSWSTFEVARDAYVRSDKLAGIGFVFTKEDEFAGIDLDNCLDDHGAFIWGREIIDELASYSEVSPSGRGVKIFLRATKPPFAKCRRDGLGPDRRGELEIYDQRRFFAVTGNALSNTPTDVACRQPELDRLCDRLWPNTSTPEGPQVGAFDDCLQSMRAMDVPDHNDGSFRLFAASCRCVEHNLSDTESIACIRAYERDQPFPTTWSDADILKRIRDAERRCRRGSVAPNVMEQIAPACKSVAQLLIDYPELREPVIHGILRTGESMNVIAPSKIGKSWLVTDLALALATGRKWLGTFETESGNVLVLDNELHAETSAHRILKIAFARDIEIQDVGESIFVDNLRGRLKNIFSLAPYFQALRPGFFKIIVMDAFYRFLPKDTDENSNANLTDIYNQIDWYAALLGCSFILVHHASKGNQSGKSVTDVGAGAGSQSRATDTHVILRPHEETDCVVLEAAVRSWSPIEPRVLRWTFPVWSPDDSLDPAALRPERPKRKKKVEPETPRNPKWDAQRLAAELTTTNPIPRQSLLDALVEQGVSQKRAKLVLAQAEAAGLIFRWTFGANKPVEFATVPQEAVRAAG